MTTENKKTKEIKLTELTTINQLDLSGGFTCDIETGICDPTDKTTEENTEENEHANNDMV